MKQRTYYTNKAIVDFAIAFLFLDRYRAPGWMWGTFWTLAAIILVISVVLDIGESVEATKS